MVIIAAPTKADVWQGIASAADQRRLANVSGAWAAGLADARTGGFTTALRDDAELIKANAALARPAPTPGSYRCSLLKLGGKPAFEKTVPQAGTGPIRAWESGKGWFVAGRRFGAGEAGGFRAGLGA